MTNLAWQQNISVHVPPAPPQLLPSAAPGPSYCSPLHLSLNHSRYVNASQIFNSLTLTLPLEEMYYCNYHVGRQRTGTCRKWGSGSAELPGHKAQCLAESEHVRITWCHPGSESSPVKTAWGRCIHFVLVHILKAVYLKRRAQVDYNAHWEADQLSHLITLLPLRAAAFTLPWAGISCRGNADTEVGF